MLLVDGGLVNPVPSSVARAMGADYVIAVDLNHGAAGLGADGSWGRERPEVPVESDQPGTSAADAPACSSSTRTSCHWTRSTARRTA